MTGGWDAQQREWLHALGYEVMVPLAGTGAGVAPSVAEPEVAVEAMPVGAAPAGRAARALQDDALARALARAARCNGPEPLLALPLDLDALRRDPAAKRALWPRLRTMRKVGR